MMVKSVKEQVIFDRFRQAYTDFPKGKLIKSESPDFLLKISPRKTIGIELTALPRPSYELDIHLLQDFLKDIQNAIIKKEDKLALYRKKWAIEYWLVIYADSIIFNRKSLFHSIKDFKPATGFNHIFLLDLFEGKVWGFPLARE